MFSDMHVGPPDNHPCILGGQCDGHKKVFAVDKTKILPHKETKPVAVYEINTDISSKSWITVDNVLKMFNANVLFLNLFK